AHAPTAAAIREGQVLAVGVELPTGDLVFDRAAVVREARVALVARALRLAVGVEAATCGPGAVGSGLAGLQVEGATKANAWARRLHAVGKSLALMPRSSIHQRRHVLRMNCTTRMASSMAACLAGVTLSLYS